MVHAHEYSAGALKIVHPFAAVSPPGATSGAAFIVRIENARPEQDRLIRATSPIASQVLLHQHETTSNGVMKMREVGFISVEGGANTNLGRDSGYHLMLHKLQKPLVAGDKFPATLYFERAGPVEVHFAVTPSASGSADKVQHHKH
ncbi:hypothetical protein C7T35_10170 [Variovorax sp. WS11]|uniref:copper chaperone PCu(A)C n=1 Tax=Variovorax sp. WS11 TaxID=1105204 RepID=UPI000D0E2929|nr:copper chaperone PCu(A)C [Variovorax sp. WS11]NDZ12716.1 copper chaperone PCu(A)C [Variovorax sp. WS11]PSL84658.1 hypothetical protein C7T35_10170 [Variovorax sp. WS11]